MPPLPLLPFILPTLLPPQHQVVLRQGGEGRPEVCVEEPEQQQVTIGQYRSPQGQCRSPQGQCRSPEQQQVWRDGGLRDLQLPHGVQPRHGRQQRAHVSSVPSQ